MCEVQCVGADTQMVQLESSFGIRLRLSAGSLHVDTRVRQSDSQRVDNGPHDAPPPLSFENNALIAMNPKNLAVRRGDAFQGGRRPARKGVLGLAGGEHPDVPRGYDPGPVREAAKAHRTPGRRVHQPMGHREIHVAKIHPLELRRRRIEPHRSRDIRHIPVRHRFELHPDKPASAGPDPQAVRIEKRIGEQNSGVGSPKLRRLGREPREPSVHEGVGRTGDVRYGHEGLPMDSILELHLSSAFVEMPPYAQHLVPVEPSLLRPPRRCERLARLVPDFGDGQPLFRVQMAPGTDCRADSLQRNRIDRRGYLHRQGVPDGDAEERRVRGCVPDPLSSHPVLAGCGRVELEQARAALRNRSLDAPAAAVHQGHHRP